MELSKRIVGERYAKLRRNGELFNVIDPASDEEQGFMVDAMKMVDGSLTPKVILARKVKVTAPLKEWMERHCKFGHYVNQVAI